MRNPFIAVDAATDLRARARGLRRSWEGAMRGGGTADVRPVIERSWRRVTEGGLDPDRLRPRRALAPGALEDARAASPLSEVIGLLRGYLGRFADDAEHLMAVVDGHGRVLWIEGDARVRRRADAIEFREGMTGARAAPAPTRSAPRSRSSMQCRSSRLSTSCPSSTRGGAQPPRSTTQ